MSRIINDFRNSVPRINEEQERANKELILEHLRDTRMEENTRFVVEGATVVCTQMKTAPIPRIQVSESKMKKLEADVRNRRIRLIARRNPRRLLDRSNRTANLRDRFNAVGNEDVTPQELIMDVNGRELLTHLDIEFEPLFTNAKEAEAKALEELRPDGVKGPIHPSALERLISELEGCGGCKGKAGDGDCKPDIEQLMWLDTDEDVGVSGTSTLLMNTAYMFCHHGQGLLYIEESGQYNTELARAARELWSDDEDIEEERNGFIPRSLSPAGRIMIRDFEMTLGEAYARGIGQFDNQGNLIGIYPHYVFRTNVTTGAVESDGGITLGFGFLITAGMYERDERDSQRLMATYAPGASFIPPHIPANGHTYRVPNSNPMSVDDATEFKRYTSPVFENPVNDFARLHDIFLTQEQFDSLVSFTYNLGQYYWITFPNNNFPQYLENGPPYDPATIQSLMGAYTNRGLAGLVIRRRLEAELFNTGRYP